MAANDPRYQYQSIFSPSTRAERTQNFISYWHFCQSHAGGLLEAEQDLTKK
jgi:hypothetical protein